MEYLSSGKEIALAINPMSDGPISVMKTRDFAHHPHPGKLTGRFWRTSLESIVTSELVVILKPARQLLHGFQCRRKVYEPQIVPFELSDKSS